MKPLRLEMSAFGPYADMEILDFNVLGDRKFFLIYGPTGAGKTTILDAMCYALYGSTSGDVRSGDSMRSDYATLTRETYVSFDFAIGAKAYRVVRFPRQEVAKKRGTGTRVETAKAALYQLSAEGSEEALLASKDVTAMVESLLGFRGDQFRQVVLLPQGDFRKLLIAGSDERENVMKILFHTELYERVEQLLGEDYKQIHSSYEEFKVKIEQQLEQNDVDTVELLAARVAERQGAYGQAVATTAEAERAMKEYQKIYQEARSLADHGQTLRNQEKQLAVLLEQEVSMKALQGQIAQIRKAELLREPYEHMEGIRNEGMLLRTALSTYEAGRDNFANRLKKVTAAFDELGCSAQSQRRAVVKKMELEQLQSGFSAYVQVRDETADLGADLAVQQKALDELATALEEHRQQLIEGEQKSEALQHIDVAVVQLKAQWEKTKERYVIEQRLVTAKIDMDKQQGELNALVKKAAEAEEKSRQDKLIFSALQDRYLQGQASVMARELAGGQACPVCGAMEHPHLAAVPTDLPAAEDVERAEKQYATAERERQQVQTVLASRRAAYQARCQQYAVERQQYPPDGSVNDWCQRVEAMKEDYDGALQKQKNSTTIAEENKKLRLVVSEEELRIKEQQTQFQGVKSRYDSALATLRIKEQAIPAAYREPLVLETAIAQWQKKIDEYEKKERQLRTEKEQYAQELAAATREVELRKQEINQKRQNYKEAYDVFSARVREAGFLSIAECVELQPLINGVEKQEHQCAQYKTSVEAMKTAILREKEIIAGRSLPQDMALYGREMDSRTSAYGAASQLKSRLQTEWEGLKKSLDAIRSMEENQKKLADENQIVGELYELTAGKESKITFQRFVLGALLDEVTMAANGRLKEMSRDRYLLQRTGENKDRRKIAGLDLAVYDNYTGQSRAAATLSGGETFLASLSLALGLADVVQAYAGGIHLDTMFIDEGFGTLDQETLDFALKALLNLQKGGRLVGIISHLAELKERIDVRLKITKTDRGSHAEFELA